MIKQTGRPLETTVRQDFEHVLGHDLSAIRIHSDGEAARSAGELGARAWTLGRHVTIAPALRNLANPGGRALLAHELRHAVQQRAFPDHHLVGVPVLGADHPSELEARRVGGRLTPLTTPALQCDRDGSTLDWLSDAYPRGTLDEKGWRSQFDVAEGAIAAGDTRAAVPAYMTLLLDAAGVAGTAEVLYRPGKISVVSGTKDNNHGVRPGLNLTLSNRDQWGANASTGFVDPQGRFGHVDLNPPGQLQPAVAIVLTRSAFFADKGRTLGILRHELTHAEDDSRAATEAFLARPGSAPAHVHDFAADTELLGHVEGFMIMFQLADPVPDARDHPAFLQLLAALDTGDGLLPWAEAKDDTRSVALRRFEEYCRTVLDVRHIEALSGWVDAQLAAATTDQFLLGENVTRELSPGSISDKNLDVLTRRGSADTLGAAIRTRTKRGDFFRALRGIILGSARRRVSMHLPGG